MNSGLRIAVILAGSVSVGLTGHCAPVPALSNNSSASVISSVNQVRVLPEDEAKRGLPVQLESVVSYYDPTWKLLFVQDSSGGVRVDPLGDLVELKNGDHVEIRGVTGFNGGCPIVRGQSLKVIHRAPALLAKKVSVEDLLRGVAPDQWVQVTGVVRSVEERSGRIVETLVADGRRLTVMIYSLPRGNRTELVGAMVTIRGVSCGELNQRPELKGVRLLVPELSDMTITKAAEAPFDLPVESPTIFSGTGAARQPDRRIRLQGIAASSDPGHSLVLSNGPLTITADTAQKTPVTPGFLVDVVGFPVKGSAPSLEDAVYRRIGWAPGPSNSLPVLTSVRQVHELTVEQATNAYPVRLRGVITYYDSDWGMMFFQGATDGIYVDPEQAFDIAAGDLVWLEGTSGPGNFAPVIKRPRFQVLGQAPMPPPLERTFAELITGKNDSQWIEIEGVVQAVTLDGSHLLLHIRTHSGGRFEAYIPNFVHKPTPSELVDADVLLRGVCGAIFNPNRQILGIQLFVPSLGCVQVQEAGVAAGTGAPQLPIHSLLRFAPGDRANHRVKIQGIVTVQLSSGMLFVQDETGSLSVSSREMPALQQGDRVEVVGFPVAGALAPAMEDAQVIKIGQGKMPQPVSMTAQELMTGINEGRIYDTRRVRVAARLLDCIRNSSENLLVLEDGDLIFNAQLEALKEPLPSRLMQKGSLLQLTGICALQVDEFHQPKGFRLLVGSPREILVLKAPSWWTQQRLWQVLLGMSVVIILAGIWVVTLRQQVKRESARVRAQLEKEAELETRFRDLVEHAADIIYSHDLEGNFTSINLAGERLLGYRPGEIVGQHISLLLSDNTVALARQHQLRKLDGETCTTYELEYRHRDGHPVVVEISSWLLRQNGHPVGVQGIARDITARKQSERKLVERTQLATLSAEVAVALTAGKNLAEILQECTELLVSHLDVAFARIWTLNPEQNVLELRASAGIYTHLNGAHSRVEVGKLNIGLIAEERKAHLTNSVVGDPRVRDQEWARSEGMVAFAGYPLLVEDRLIGVVAMFARHPLSDFVLNSISGVASHIGLCIDRHRAAAELERTHRDLLDTSRRAGMAEVATNVLHNVGNVLNSVNISASLASETVRKSKVSSFVKTTALLREHSEDLGTFLMHDPAGRQVPAFLEALANTLAAEQQRVLEELSALGKNIEHIKVIVAMQQSYAKVAGVAETASPVELVEDALRMNLAALERHGVQVIREYPHRAIMPSITIERHKVLQILVNLIRNAKYALTDSRRPDKQMRLRIAFTDNRFVQISVHDNGVGIPAENLTRIFNHGFTTRKDGHGFGLHSGALAAKEMGGTLRVMSAGPGQGATFILELPCDSVAQACPAAMVHHAPT